MTTSLPLFERHADFVAAMNRHQAARWIPHSGVELIFQYGESGKELMMQIQPGQQYPGMLRNILSRRYTEAANIENCHLALNGDNVLILWWSLLQPPVEYPAVIRQLFHLAGLELPT
ncbi:HrpV family type III secretion system protein [Pectobacteriaceae bacterium CE70]|nr:HrpV family type III secretion system protein [Pectobacteriaceae bacterium CE70]WJY12781.1 HrpV family type III secretion system protein [Pectobacteriaceae bacterium C80]